MKRTKRPLSLSKETLTRATGSWPINTTTIATNKGVSCGPACPPTNSQAYTICNVSCAPGCFTTLL